MDVSVIGNGPGGVATPLRPGAEGTAPPSPQGGGTESIGTDNLRVVAVPVQNQVVRHAWFDLNGDGKIEDRYALYGGDAYLVWDPGPGTRSGATHTVARVRRVAEPPGPRPRALQSESVHADTPAVVVPLPAPVTRQAIDAYQRYGQEPAPANHITADVA